MNNQNEILKEDQKILVIDDEQGIRDLLQNEFTLLGYKVITANNGLDGIEILKKEKVNLVISDMKMPKMDGLQVLENVKKIDSDTEVIMITGYGTIASAVESMKRGAYDFVQKPFNLDEITSLAEKALEKAELRVLLALYEASKVIFSVVKLEELLPVLIGLSRKILRTENASIMLFGPDKKLYIASSYGIDDDIKKSVHLAIGERVAGKIAEWKKTTIIVGPLEKDPRFTGINGRDQIKSSIICPLLAKTDILGVLCAARTKSEVPFNVSDLRFGNIFSAQVSQAIDNARLYDELQKKIDALNQAYTKLADMQNEIIQTEKLAAIGELTSGVAHELNNPLTTIIGLVDLLMEESIAQPASSLEDLKTIKEQAGRCSRIILNLLQFSRRHETEKKMTQINEILDKSLELIQYEFKNSDIALVKNYAEDMPEAKVDPFHIQQVFLNILNNARHALKDKTKPTITVKTEHAAEKIKIYLSDNGCGISPNIINKIFDPFFTTKEVGKGTGLGLSISYGIIREHGGEIHVQSKEGEGSMFIIELPVQSKK